MLDFLIPISDEIDNFIKTIHPQSIGKSVLCHTKKYFPNLEGVEIVILGVLENRGFNDEVVDNTHIRKNFYSLFPGNWNKKIVDLGDLPQGASVDDSYFALTRIVKELITLKIFPIIIGGSQDNTYAIYRAFDDFNKMVTITSIDHQLNLAQHEELRKSETYLSRIILEEPNNLFNFNNIGFQMYFNSQEEIDLMEKLYFDRIRLGDINQNIKVVEPVLRESEIVSFDLNSIKSIASGRVDPFQPNGFDSIEACAIARYTGISEKNLCFSLFHHNNNNNYSLLIAEMIWYYIEGMHYKVIENPYNNSNKFTKYIVPFEDENYIFFKSISTEKWWIEINLDFNHNNKNKKPTLFSCSEDDFHKIQQGEIPDKLWKTQRKTMI
jgi:arginase family enzyme